MIVNEELEALRALLDQPGWQVYLRHAHQEWGAGGARFETQINALADSRADDAETLMHMRQIAVARREILRLLQWPEERIAMLQKAAADPVAPNARVPLPHALTGYSRRGSA